MSQSKSLKFYLNVSTGVLLGISEFLPYIKDIKANGILHCLTESFKKKADLLQEPIKEKDFNYTLNINQYIFVKKS